MEKHDISMELYREYDFAGRTYKIENPVTLMFRVGGTTHRVITADGIVHCVPAPGVNGCVLRWMSKDSGKPVHF